MDNHIKSHHQNLGDLYICHLCSKRFNEGYKLGRHLARTHDFKWPSGHSRFRFKEDEQGYYRIQTERFESLEINDEEMADDIHEEEDDEGEDGTRDLGAIEDDEENEDDPEAIVDVEGDAT